MHRATGSAHGRLSTSDVIVAIVWLGIVGATALPRVFPSSEDPSGADVHRVRDSLDAGVELAHAAWLAAGAEPSVDSITLEGTTLVGVNDSGWPENASTGDGEITAAECVEVWNAVMAGPPGAVRTGAGAYGVSLSGTTCRYTLQADSGASILYDPRRGEVSLELP